jgi:hypothetical protein
MRLIYITQHTHRTHTRTHAARACAHAHTQLARVHTHTAHSTQPPHPHPHPQSAVATPAPAPRESVRRAKQTHSGPKLRFGPAATTCAKVAKAESEPEAGRGEHMKHVAPHEISGPKSARPHGGIPSPGAEQRRGLWVVSGQGFT